MPIYEYRCRNGHSFEIMQSMSDDPVSSCEQCGAPVERVFHPVAVHFKGSGFYTTDYKKKGSAAKAASDGGESSGGGESKSDSKTDSKTDSKPEKKADAKKAE
jgi:putative FmdB family regulatory protein